MIIADVKNQCFSRKFLLFQPVEFKQDSSQRILLLFGIMCYIWLTSNSRQVQLYCALIQTKKQTQSFLAFLNPALADAKF